jgi:hypothetical protein
MSGFFNLIKHGKNIVKSVAAPLTQLRNIRAAKKRDTYKTISSIEPSKNLKKRLDTKQDIFKSVDEKAGSNVSNQKKSEIKQSASKKVSKIYDEAEGKAKGGRAGFKRGTGLMKKKSNVDKIKKSFGTLSVRAGIDNNPNPTYADKIAGAKMKNKKTKKKVI